MTLRNAPKCFRFWNSKFSESEEFCDTLASEQSSAKSLDWRSQLSTWSRHLKWPMVRTECFSYEKQPKHLHSIGLSLETEHFGQTKSRTNSFQWKWFSREDPNERIAVIGIVFIATRFEFFNLEWQEVNRQMELVWRELLLCSDQTCESIRRRFPVIWLNIHPPYQFRWDEPSDFKFIAIKG